MEKGREGRLYRCYQIIIPTLFHAALYIHDISHLTLFFSLLFVILYHHPPFLKKKKRPRCWERLKAGEQDHRGQDGWLASPTQWTWVWASSRRRWSLESSLPWGGKESDTTEQLNNNLKINFLFISLQKEHRTWLNSRTLTQTFWILTLTLFRCVILDGLRKFSIPQFPLKKSYHVNLHTFDPCFLIAALNVPCFIQ